MNHQFQARARTQAGKGASRRLRHQGEVPGILYGVGFEAQSIVFTQRDIQMALDHESFISQIIELHIDGTKHQALLKAVHRHPHKNIILHADFLKVTKDTEVTLSVPIHFINEEQCDGVRQGGGVLTKTLSELEIRAKASALPEYIEVDLQHIKLGEVLHLSDLKLPKGVASSSLVKGTDLPIVQVTAFKESKEAGAPLGDPEADSSDESTES